MGDTLKIKVTAPPVDSAVIALVEFFGGLIGYFESSVQILKGQTSRSKVVQISASNRSDIEETHKQTITCI